MRIDQLTSANTFEEWLLTTSSLIAVANNLTDNTYGGFLANSSIFIEGGAASLNVRTLANINTLHANTGNLANTSFENSNGTIQLDLIVGRNLVSDLVYATDVYAYGILFNPNAAYDQANTGFIQANASFIHANSGFIQTNASFNHANSGFNQTNISFNQANSGFNQTNLTFNQANSGFIQANASFNHANSSFANANGAFAAANAAYIQANSGFIQANASFIHANSGFNQTNLTFNQVNSAFNQANVSFIPANSEFIQANAAFIRANNSLDANNGGIVTGNITVITTFGLEIEESLTQDSIIIKGRSGGTNSYSTTIVPSTLDSNKVITVPNENFTVGFRNIVAVGQKTSAYTLNRNDVGKFVELKAGGSINIPNAVFEEGDVAVILNSTDTKIRINYSISTAHCAGIDSDISLANVPVRGVATILFIDPNTCVTSGIIDYA